MEDTELQDDIDIDAMLYVSALHKYFNRKFNQESQSPSISFKCHHQTIHKFQH